MLNKLHADAECIIQQSIKAVLPDTAVQRALRGKSFPGKVILVAVGKAAWQMAKAAHKCLGESISKGIVVTKYDHVKGPIGDFLLFEAGHPVPDENTFAATRVVLDMVSGLSKSDTVLFLLSGGGSALFELPLIPPEELQEITGQLLGCGADIVEINTIRKRLSAVKGGRFAQKCLPASVYSIILSDIVGDPLDMIASGPAAVDLSTCRQAEEIVNKYSLCLSAQARSLLGIETEKQLFNVENHITGSVKELCAAAATAAEALGYESVILADDLTDEARVAGENLARTALRRAADGKNIALIVGGETVVHLTGKGKGGRNQELALSAAGIISGHDNIVVFSVGSDGTDGPTDAAGGIVDGSTATDLMNMGISIPCVLQDNDAYRALKKVNALIFTGPTGTNVNDVALALVRFSL